jgi:hypothetical protein
MLSLVRFADGRIADHPHPVQGGPASSQNVCIATNVTQTLTLEVTVQMFGILGGFNEQTLHPGPRGSRGLPGVFQ